MIKLGERVKDTVTDFKGMAIARCEYLNGCIRIQVQPKELNKDGKIIESEWIDEGQLIREIEEEALGLRREKKYGGPGTVPSEISHP